MPMSEDAHLGHDSHQAPSPTEAVGDAGVHFATSTPAPEEKSENSVTIKMLPGSGIWKKGRMQTFGPKTVTIKAGMSVVFKNADVGMAIACLAKKANSRRPCCGQATRSQNVLIRRA